MARFSRHPASAPPVAPERERTGHLLLRGWMVFSLFFAFTAPGWVLGFGIPVTAMVGGLIVAGSAVMVAVIRPPFQWRRLPWIAGTFILWAGLSIAWSGWRETSALTWLLLAATTFQGIAVASVLTWREIVRAIGSALGWVVGLSLAAEMLVAWIVGGTLYAGFETDADAGAAEWIGGGILSGARIDGVVGNPNLLGMIALMAVIVFTIEFAARASRRIMLGVWIGLATVTFVLAASVTAWIAAAGVALVLATVLLMRTARRPGERTRYYVGYAVVGAAGALALWIWRTPVFTALDRSADLLDRETIWTAVLDRAGGHLAVGGGFATPWLPWDPAFQGWIVLEGTQITQAHSVWVDVLFQLGVVGVMLLALTYLAFVWRSWFFAVDRPRWDLRDDRPYSALTLLPTLTGAVLLVQGLAETAPLMGWGWMLMILLGSKIKQSPHIGEGPAEQRLAIERGELVSTR